MTSCLKTWNGSAPQLRSKSFAIDRSFQMPVVYQSVKSLYLFTTLNKGICKASHLQIERSAFAGKQTTLRSHPPSQR